jgi:hypothetical protein
MFISESSGYSIWDELEDNPKFHERNPENTKSEPLEGGFIAPDDVLVPRPELGPNVYTLFMKGGFIPLSLLKRSDGSSVIAEPKCDVYLAELRIF